MIRFSFWKDHLGCGVDGELKIVESRSRNSNKNTTTVVQVRDDEGWCGRNYSALPRSPFSKREPPSPAVTVDADNSQLPLSPENQPTLTAATLPRKQSVMPSC